MGLLPSVRLVAPHDDAHHRQFWSIYGSGMKKPRFHCGNAVPEREGFEPPLRLPADRISNAAPSAARPPLLGLRITAAGIRGPSRSGFWSISADLSTSGIGGHTSSAC
jgi:hypothetical protein